MYPTHHKLPLQAAPFSFKARWLGSTWSKPSPVKKKRVDYCQYLLSYHRNFSWLDNLITGDEKWVVYMNATRRRQWLKPGQAAKTTPKAGLHPKLAPSDYHLFRSLSNDLRDRKFIEEKDLKMYLKDFFDSNSHEFYSSGIHKLAMRWQEVVNSNGAYSVSK